MFTPPSLRDVSDLDLLDLLDQVSAEIKRRNSLMPKTAGQAVVDVMKALSDMTSGTKKP